MQLSKLHNVIQEMAKEPQRRIKADRLASILPPNKKEATAAIRAFWDSYLEGDFGWGAPPRIMDEIINVKKVELIGGEKVPFLEWYGVVVFTPKKGINMTMIITSLDEPGAYRMDFILPGAKRALVKSIRSRVVQDVQRMEDKITTTLNDADLKELKRIRTSMKPVPHTHKPGMRQDDMLIGRLNLDDIPLSGLHKRADQLRNITKHIGQVAIEESGQKKKGDSEESPLMNAL